MKLFSAGMLALTCILFLSTVAAEDLIEAEGQVLSGPIPVHEETPTEKTFNKDVKSITKFLKNHLQKITQVGDNKVLFMFKSSWPFGIDTENGRVSDFVLRENDQFRQLDDHGSTIFKLIKITDDSVRLGYVSEFNHNSFGKNLITIDEGEIDLFYTD